jgi:Putative transmembrane protein (PGPGW)
MKENFTKAWKQLPRTLRKTIALVVGFTLIITGLLLVILPGQFTLLLVALGLVILALEFAWVDTLLHRVRKEGAKINPRGSSKIVEKSLGFVG